ncbi:EAL domain-containing protein [soil metagenome]
MASLIYGTPVSAVSLTDRDRQWFKSRVGCGTHIPREGAPCAEVTRTGDVLVVSDLATDPRFAASVLIPAGVRFYAGAPLTTPDGHTLGAMCVLDMAPRDMAPEEASALRDLAAMVMAQIELQHALGRIDPASGLPNRHQFVDDLEDAGLDGAAQDVAVVVLDIADPARLAQAMRVVGPSYLDSAVGAAVAAIRPLLPATAKLYQVGATQLAILLRDGSCREALVGELGACIADGRIDRKATIGVAASLGAGMSAEHALRAARNAAQDARDGMRVLSSHSPSNDEAHRRRFDLIAGLEAALAGGGGLELVYQPRLDLGSGRCRSVEALLRWTHPALGPVSPGEFIPLAEAAGLARPVTAFVLEAALAQAAAWREEGIGLGVSVNVSAHNLEEPGFWEEVADALFRRGLASDALEIEFTESALIRDRAAVLANLGHLRKLGVAAAIDDFGTGYSSFSYLQDIPADTIKIDQSVVRTLEPGDRLSVLVRSMIEMAHGLGYRVVAEGIETDRARAHLAALDCDEGQGYFFCRPVPAAALAAWLARRETDRKAAA